VGGAVFLGIFNIYLAGHGIDWPNQEFESGPVGMSPLSVTLGVIVFTTFFVSFALSFHLQREDSGD
jgi:hypothetical protein